MIKSLALVALVPLALCAPSRPYGLPGLLGGARLGYGIAPAAIAKAPACRTEYETVVTKQCSTSYSKACRTETKTKYKTEYDTECQTVTRQNCYAVAKQVPDQVCATRLEKVCTQETQKTYDVQLEQNCQDVQQKVCAPVVASGYAGYGRKRRDADASGGYGLAAPACKIITKKVCSANPVKTPRYVNVPKCQAVPKTDCKDISRTVTETKCDPIEEQKCQQVPRQATYEAPIEICEDVPTENCVDVPKAVPKKICKEYKH